MRNKKLPRKVTAPLFRCGAWLALAFFHGYRYIALEQQLVDFCGATVWAFTAAIAYMIYRDRRERHNRKPPW